MTQPDDSYAELKKKTDKGEIVWHYTNWDSLLGIASTNRLWASNANFLNDTQELKCGLSTIEAAFNKSGHQDVVQACKQFASPDAPGYSEPEVYVASFSSAFDLLSQWRGYGGSTPIAVAFATDQVGNRMNEVKNNVKELMMPLNNHQSDFELGFQRCIYSDYSDQPSRFLDQIESLIGKLDEAKIVSGDQSRGPGRGYAEYWEKVKFCRERYKLAAFVKHESFSEEKEWRIVLVNRTHKDTQLMAKGYPNVGSATPYLKLNFRRRGEMVVPYFEIPLLGSAFSPAAVMVGPSAHKESLVYSVQTLLSANPHIDIVYSKSTFRHV